MSTLRYGPPEVPASARTRTRIGVVVYALAAAACVLPGLVWLAGRQGLSSQQPSPLWGRCQGDWSECHFSPRELWDMQMQTVTGLALAAGIFVAVCYAVSRARQHSTRYWRGTSIAVAVLMGVPAVLLWLLAVAFFNTTCGEGDFLCFAGPGVAAAVAVPAALASLLSASQVYGVVSATDRARWCASIGVGVVAGLTAATLGVVAFIIVLS